MPKLNKDELQNSLVQFSEITDRGDIGLAVFHQDQATELLIIPFLSSRVSGLSLAQPTVIGSHSIVLAVNHGLTTANSKGHIIELAVEESGIFYQGRIVSVAGNVVTVGPLLSNVFSPSDTIVGTGNPNLATDPATGLPIDGSVTPVIYTVKPLPGQAGDINKIVFACSSEAAGDMSTFGSAAELSRGLTLRVKRSDLSYRNIITFVNNFNLFLGGGEIQFYDPKLGNSLHSVGGHITFNGQNHAGVVVRLDGNLDEELQLVVSELMDNSSVGNNNIYFFGIGSELQGA